MLDHSSQSRRHPLAARGCDLYSDPEVATRSLLPVEKLPRRIWDPCAGRGNTVRVLRDAGHEVIASDLYDHGFPLDFQRDFLAETSLPADCEGIVSNPPIRSAPAQRHSYCMPSTSRPRSSC
jgi:hypothetical protein